MEIYRIYTDGSTLGNGTNGAVGGWAFAVTDDDKNIITHSSGGEVNTTNNRMELTAAIQGLKSPIIQTALEAGARVSIYSDSAYLINCVRQGWYVKWRENGWKNSKGEPVANKDLWEKLIPYFRRCMIDWWKVTGHSSNELNNYVDSLAVKASTDLKGSLDR